MKSGNNTAAPQWIYIGIHMIFYVIPNPFVFKMGIGGSWMNRLKGVSKTLPGFVLPVFLVWVPFAYHIEQWTHRQMRPLNVPYFGSGKTEWFFIPGIVFAIGVITVIFALWAGFFALLVAYTVEGEKGAQIALKWLVENWKPFLYFVGAGKLAVIFTQIIFRR